MEVFHGTATDCHLPYGITLFSHSVTCYPTQVNTPRLNPSHAGRYSLYLPRRDGRPSWLDSAPAGSRQRPFDHESDAQPLQPPRQLLAI